MWIPKSDFEALTGKAGKYDAIVASILKSNEKMTADDVTPEFIQEALTAGDEVKADEELSAKVNDLQGKVDTLTSDVANVTKERDDLQSEVKQLRELPGAESVVETTARPKAEAGAIAGSGDEILDFAKKNPTDTASIAAMISKEGIENFKIS